MDNLLRKFLMSLGSGTAKAISKQVSQKKIADQEKANQEREEIESLIYRPKEILSYPHREIEYIRLTAKEAIQMGYSFRKKSKSIRITNYHGQAETLILPSEIDGIKVNEISTKAFYQDQHVKQLQIPGCIKKIGEYAFAESQLESCIFADGMAYIPKGAFSKCKSLSRVALPWNVAEIRENAFENCKKLEFMLFPMCCHTYQDNAFLYSGLKEFAKEKSIYSVWNGRAFLETPLSRNYALILADARKDRMNILLVGNKNNRFKIPASDRLNFGKNAFSHHVVLDMTECKNISFFDSFIDSIYCSYYYGYYYTILYLPENYQKRVQTPYNTVHTRLGHTSNSALQCVSHHIDSGHDTVVIRDTSHIGKNDFEYSISGKINKITLRRGDGNFLCWIDAETFQSGILEEVNFEMPFQSDSPLFSSKCQFLRKVSWLEKGQTVTKYIPDYFLLDSVAVHHELIKAFMHTGTHFFDSRMIDKGFGQQKYSYINKQGDKIKQSGTHTRARIFIAIDVLRSTHRPCDTPTEPYLYYLEHHKEQAIQLCEAVQKDYPEYLEYLKSLPFMNNIR